MKKIAVLVILIVSRTAAVENIEPESKVIAQSESAYTWGIQPGFTVHYNSLLGLEGDLSAIVGLHMPEHGAKSTHMYGYTYGIAASIGESFAGSLWGIGIGAGEVVQGGGALSARLEYINLYPRREFQEIDVDHRYAGLRLTVSCFLSMSVSYLRNTDDHINDAYAFGIGVGF